jgi:ribosomal 30S subunit maturation factor RimM
MKKVLTHPSNLLTNNNLFFLGVLGKPHALNGFLYLNQDIYFRTFDLTGINVFINGNSFKIQKFKTHLKNRYLIKFEGLDSISDIEAFRNQNIYISSEQINTFISNGLPWPGCKPKNHLRGGQR